MSSDPRKWEAKLEGNKFDLKKLPIHFVGEDCRVSEKDGAYILTANELESSKDHKDANARATQLVSRINGAMRLLDSSYEPMRLAHVVGYTELGGPIVAVSFTETFLIRAGSLDLGGGPTRDHRISRLVRLSGIDSDLGAILVELSDESVDWGRLYKVLELIEKRAGGNVVTLKWCSRRQRKHFMMSANTPLAGAGARHAVPRGGSAAIPPRMSLNEAKTLVRMLAKKLAEQVIAQDQCGS